MQSQENSASNSSAASGQALRAANDKAQSQLKLLNELSTRLQSLLESENIFQEVVNLLQSRFNPHSVHIWSVASDQTTKLEAQTGAYRNHVKLGHRMKIGEGITGLVVRERKSHLANDVSKDPHFTNLAAPVNTRAQLSVPVIKERELLAVLTIESDEVGAFDENDVMTLESVASQIAVAIANQRLYAHAKDFSKRLQEAVDEKTLELRRAQERILEQQKLLQRENKALKTLVKPSDLMADIVGNSSAIHATLAMVDKIAPTTATVLIQGESGTGKELIARRLHFKSDRSTHPYVTVNCGALQESLLESELFGHEKGSFTGAHVQKLGLCETAEGGTLFLDEIGELSLGIQTKLLRFLQEGEFYRIGGKKPIQVDVRVVSATNRDLEQEVKAGRFREDLYYRLNTITLRMPPLRKRKEDIPMLVEHFLRSSRFGGTTSQPCRIGPRVMDALQGYDWPGNIRELQNTIERLKILAENNEIKLDDIPFSIRVPKLRTEGSELSVEMTLDEVEKNHILRTLAYHHGNKTKAAQGLGITIKTLYNKLHRYGILKTAEETAAAAALGTTPSATE